MSHRYRLYPTTKQEKVMARHCADARFVWNLALEQANLWRPHWGPTPSNAQRMRQLTEARQGTWLGEGSCGIQQQALRDFDRAQRNWWAGSHRRPTWRRKGTREGFCAQAITTTKRTERWAEVTIPKAGRVRFRLSRPVPVKHGGIRVTLDRAGRWHVSFSGPQLPIAREPTGAVVGLDRGIAITIATSDGGRLTCPRPSASERIMRRRLQRHLSRRKKGSARYERLRLRLARLTVRWADRRKDWIEKVSTTLVRIYDVIALENLRVPQMLRSARPKRGLNRSISESGWGLLAKRIAEKATASDVVVVTVNPKFTSQQCSVCGCIAAESRKNQARFTCVECGREANADINAALNIRAAGLAVLGRGGVGVIMPPREASTSEVTWGMPIPPVSKAGETIDQVPRRGPPLLSILTPPTEVMADA